MKVLYLSYDGALDPLGRSQVVPYLEGLAGRGHAFDLLTFEKPVRLAEAGEVRAMEERLSRSGVRWHPLPYHKRPPVASTAWDMAAAYVAARRIVRERRPDLLHARSYPAALVADRVGRASGLPWLFDMRGLWADERVDGGLWSGGGLLYHVTRRVERDLLAGADAVVTLTDASVTVVRGLMERAGAPGTPLRVIPTCVDTERFRPVADSVAPAPARREAPPADPSGGAGAGAAPDSASPRPVLAYFGSVGTWYMLREMLRLGRAWVEAADPAGRLLFLVNQGADEVRRAAAEAGVPPGALEVRSVAHEEVPGALAAARATFYLIRPAPSKIASAATKFGESLALGLPVLINDGVGDAAAVARRDRVGVVVDGFDDDAYRVAVRSLRALLEDPDVGARCRKSALARYDLEKGVAAYDALYREVADAAADPKPPGTAA